LELSYLVLEAKLQYIGLDCTQKFIPAMHS
jgi:hypothetical protein